MGPLAPLLGALAADPARACLLSDCDGTLAPIVDDPAAAAPLPASVEALRALAGRLGRVAVVSGRPAAWLLDRFGPGPVLSGLYGLEEVGADGVVRTRPEAERWRSVVEAAAVAAEAGAPRGVVVERKGLSVTVHHRTAPEAEGWVAAFAHETAAATGLVVHPAKRSLELRVPLRVDKGTVVERLAAGAAVVAFLGDDVGDLPAFAALDRLRAAGATTVKVAVTSAELDPAVRAQADALVPSPAAVATLLEDLLTALPPPPPAPDAPPPPTA